MAAGPIKFLIFYVTFFLTVAFIGGIVPDVYSIGVGGGEGISVLPELDESKLTIVSWIEFAFNWAIYFLGLQGLVILGIPAAIALLIGVLMDTIVIYIVVRLIRGGG